MRVLLRVVIALSVGVSACQGRGAASGDTADAQQPADSPQTVSPPREPRPVDSAAALAGGKEPGYIPATPTPTVTSENAIATMRLQLQQLDTASAETLQRSMKEHGRMLGDLLTTMRVQVQGVTSASKNSWLAAADTVEGDLSRLALAQGAELRTAFRLHRDRVLRLLDEFRVLVPAS